MVAALGAIFRAPAGGVYQMPAPRGFLSRNSDSHPIVSLPLS